MPTAALALYGTTITDEANRENTTGKTVFKAAFTVAQKIKFCCTHINTEIHLRSDFFTSILSHFQLCF